MNFLNLEPIKLLYKVDSLLCRHCGFPLDYSSERIEKFGREYVVCECGNDYIIEYNK